MPRVSLAYAAPAVERLLTLDLLADATVADAMAAAALHWPEVGVVALRPAIFGRLVAATTLLAEGDRIELTRPLAVDAKSARRARAAATAANRCDAPGSLAADPWLGVVKRR